MEQIITLLEKVLNALTFDDTEVPYYFGMPDFAADEPPCYIVYDLYEDPACFADDTETVNEYNITLSICTTKPALSLYRNVKQAMKNAGFMYQYGQPMNDTDYPQNYRKIQEYKISIVTEE